MEVKSKNYWESHYAHGGSSSNQDIGLSRYLKHRIMLKYSKMDEVIDIGCGDLTFWEGYNCHDYTGVDISQTIQKKNWHARPWWKFIICNSAIPIPQRANTVICMDLLFHLESELDFILTLENIATYAKEWVFLFNWTHDLLPWWMKGLQKLGRHHPPQKYRNLDDYETIFTKAGFTQHSTEKIDENCGIWIYHRNGAGTQIPAH